MVPYDVWTSEGHVDAVSGEVLDFEDVRKKLVELSAVYDIREIGVLRYNAVDLMTKLQTDGFEVYTYSEQMKDMSPGTKALGAMLTEKKVRHGGHPVLRWMAANMAVKVDAAENMRPDNEASTERFDGIKGLIVAIGRSLAADGQDIEWSAV
jgi:phage terminase large subunit-like protein